MGGLHESKSAVEMELATRCREETWSCDAELAGRQGFYWSISRNTNKDGPFSRTPRHASNFAASCSFVGFRRFASVFDFASGMTLTMTLATKDFPVSLREDPGERAGEWFSSKWRQVFESRRLVEAERCLSQEGVEAAQAVLVLEPPIEQRAVVASRSPECRLASSGVAA
jgi:hypothetical protein